MQFIKRFRNDSYNLRMLLMALLPMVLSQMVEAHLEVSESIRILMRQQAYELV